MKCYGQVRFFDHVQEHYETASGDARKRSAQLRKAGFRVCSESSMQVTPVGLCRMTLLTAYGNMDNFPDIQVETLASPA